MNEFSYRPAPKRRSILPLVAVGAATFVIGSAGAFSLASWQASQKAKIAALEMRVEMMQDMITSPDAGVTRNATPDLTDVAAIASEAAPQAELTPVDPSAANREGLEDRIAAARALAGRIKMERLAGGQVVNRLQEEVLAGNYSIEAQSISDSTIGVNLKPANYENTAGLLADILAASAERGDIEVPDYIAVSETGEVDAGTLLFDLVQRSLQDGSVEEVAAAEQLSLRTVEAFQAIADSANGGLNVTGNDDDSTAVAQAGSTSDGQLYTVESGDNLAYLALQFYGRTDAYTVIYAANRDVLSNPDRIQVGQTLFIPDA